MPAGTTRSNGASGFAQLACADTQSFVGDDVVVAAFPDQNEMYVGASSDDTMARFEQQTGAELDQL